MSRGAGDVKVRVCPNGQPDPRWSCMFCHVRVCNADSGCGCSKYRPKVTHHASLCLACAAAIDVLMADTPVGRVHRAMVYAANLAGRPCDD